MRTTLLYGSCSVSDQPEVCTWVRSISERGLFGLNVLHHPPPQQARRAQLRDLEVEVHPDAEEERQPPGELVDVEAARDRRAHVLAPVGEREGELERLRRAGLLDVVAGDRDRVELRHVPRRVLDDVGDDPHRRFGRVDVGVADHELLEDVVLDRPRELGLLHALLLRRDDVAGEHRQHRAVHRHRHRHLVERDAVEQDLHVLDRVDRDARLADVADDARMVGVVAAVRREVERDRHALLAGGEVAAVEGVRLLGGREAGVLPDRPRPDRVHRRLRPAHERLEAGQGVRVRQSLEVLGRVERLDLDAFGRAPDELLGRAGRLRGGLLPVRERGDLGDAVVHGRASGRRRRPVAVERCGHFTGEQRVTGGRRRGRAPPAGPGGGARR